MDWLVDFLIKIFRFKSANVCDILILMNTGKMIFLWKPDISSNLPTRCDMTFRCHKTLSLNTSKTFFSSNVPTWRGLWRLVSFYFFILLFYTGIQTWIWRPPCLCPESKLSNVKTIVFTFWAIRIIRVTFPDFLDPHSLMWYLVFSPPPPLPPPHLWHDSYYQPLLVKLPKKLLCKSIWGHKFPLKLEFCFSHKVKMSKISANNHKKLSHDIFANTPSPPPMWYMVTFWLTPRPLKLFEWPLSS